MSRIILDHYRRWVRVLGVVALAEFGLGWLIALGPQYGFEFWAFALSLWAGAVLLSFDFQRGMLRPMAILPVGGRQLGRAWWMATVPLPALALAALLFSGAVACCHFRPEHVLPLPRLLMGSLFTFVWLGISFTLIFNAARGFGESRGEWRYNGVISVLTVVMFFGSMLLCQNASQSVTKSGLLLGLGGLLTVLGWLRADRFEPALAGIYLGRVFGPPPLGALSRRRTLDPRLTAIAPKLPPGRGGIRFLVSTMFVRAFAYGALMTALMALIAEFQCLALKLPLQLDLWAIMGSFMTCWFIVFFQFMPFLRHLRVLRTMPVSAAALSATLLAFVVLPVLALGALVTGIGWLAGGAAAAVTLGNSYIFTLASAALCVFLTVWRGAGTQAYLWLLCALIASVLGYLFLQGYFPFLKLPLALAGTVTIPSLSVAFILTRWVLERSTQTYRLQVDPFGRVWEGAS